MLFNSFEFAFCFLPVTLLIYFLLSQYSSKLRWDISKLWLFGCSLFFYGWWNPKYLILIVSSILINYIVGTRLGKPYRSILAKKTILIIGLLFNLGLLGYYKYANFFIDNLNSFLSLDLYLGRIILPLGISFFTFQQVAYLVDSYKGFTKEYNFINYGVFVSFFPQLIAGPIVHHKEVMEQFVTNKNITRVDYGNLSKGLFIFLLGLLKKIIIADTFSLVVNQGYSSVEFLSTAEAWITSLFYSAQLYFDFSGYSDMAIGLGLMFNIRLPINFNSPYKSQSIKEFWRRWHMTLSRFLKDYLYIPFGGNRKGELITYRNLILTFLIGGIWHGAGWTFIFWGFLHGIAIVINQLYGKLNVSMPKYLNILMTFFFVNITWVFFRAASWEQAISLLEHMFTYHEGHNNFVLITSFLDMPIFLLGFGLLFWKNPIEISESFRLSKRYVFLIIMLLFIAIIFMNSSISKEFLYFDF